MRGRIRVGIGGWTYAPWHGTFYPEGLPQERELEYAASKLDTIEINGTFYGTSARAANGYSPAAVTGWAQRAQCFADGGVPPTCGP